MDNLLNYTEIIKKTLQEATLNQPSLQTIKIYPVCDSDSGNFLVLATGFDQQKWINTILFHARLVDNNKIVIEEDNFEEGLTYSLIKAGIKEKDIIFG
jgi:hypothetical protein